MLWLRAHARKQRWDEELELVQFEMECTIRSFARKAEDGKSGGILVVLPAILHSPAGSVQCGLVYESMPLQRFLPLALGTHRE